MDLALFLGRFHPLVVHFPIGFLLLAGIFELLSKRKGFDYLGKAVPFTLLLGAISAIFSVIFGLLIAGDKGYEEETLSWHRWLGILVAVTAVAVWIFKSEFIKVPGRLLIFLFLILIMLVSLTGHLGGTLTHGEGYLTQYAPEFVQKLAGNGSKNQSVLAGLPDHPDSVLIFKDIIDPIMQNSCMPCHTESQKKGGLSLVNYADLMEGGETGEAILPGKPIESELFKRITLPPAHTKFMPLKETPLSFAEVKLIEWWIENGATEDTRLGDLQVPEYISNLMLRDFDFDVTPKPYYEITTAPEVDEALLQEIATVGLKLKKLAKDNQYLDVGLSSDEKVFTRDHLNALLRVKNSVTWLDLNGKIEDTDLLAEFGQFENLTRLNIGNNQIMDTDVTQLLELKHLESLNLYGTEITDQTMIDLSRIPSLKRVYVWQTGVTEEAIAQAKQASSSLDVVSGYQFTN